tara:strand:- start:1433 stop:2083 length:651 start_codon:yes stop_codon:yes gene_type:complete
MLEIINVDLQEQLLPTVQKKMEFLSKETFDGAEQPNADGTRNTFWNLTHFIRCGKLVTNAIYQTRSTLQKIEKGANELKRALESGGAEIAKPSTERVLFSNKYRLDNCIVELNMALAEYECCMSDTYGVGISDNNLITIKDSTIPTLNKHLKKVEADKSIPDDVKQYTYIEYSAKVQIIMCDLYSKWFTTELEYRLNPKASTEDTKTTKVSEVFGS